MAASQTSGKESKRSYHNCVVLGCFNTTANSQYTFFSLPLDGERRNEWLKLIQREDLLARSAQHSRVCEAHFPAQSVLSSPHRKVLKKDSLPRLHLPDKSQLHKSTQTPPDDAPVVYSASTASQTHKYLMHGLVSKRAPLLKFEKSGVGSRFRPAPADTERRRFLALCDRFLTRELAARVRAHTQIALDEQAYSSSDDELLNKYAKRANAETDTSTDEELIRKHTKRGKTGQSGSSSEEEIAPIVAEPATDPLQPDPAPCPDYCPILDVKIEERDESLQSHIKIIKMEKDPEQEDNNDSE